MMLLKDEPSGGVADPQSWNRYSYVGNDPINYVDPVGLFKQGKVAPPSSPALTNPFGDPLGDGTEGGGINLVQPSADPGGSMLENLRDALLSLSAGRKKFFGGEARVKELANDLNGIHIERWNSNQAIDHGQRFAYTFGRV